jgi:hypothetical protein
LKEGNVMDIIEFITYKGRKVLYLDFTNLNAMQANKYLEDSKSVIMQQPKETIFLLVNAADMQVSGNVIGILKNYIIKVINDYLTFCSRFVIASAIIPPTKLNKDFLNSIEKSRTGRIAVFDDVKKAKKWFEDK